MLQFSRFLLPVILAAVASGCAIVQVAPEGRVASDQLLVATAIEDTVRALNLKDAVQGKTVKLTVTNVGNVEQDLNYVKEALRARVLQEGGRVKADAAGAIELVAMVQTLGSDIDRSSIALPIPIPAVGSTAITELSFYNDSKQIARCRMWVYAIDSTGNLAFTHPPIHTAHRVKNPILLGVTLGKFTDVKELNHSKGDVPITNPGLTK